MLGGLLVCNATKLAVPWIIPRRTSLAAWFTEIGSYLLPAHSLPDLGAPYTKGLGVTLELWLEDHVHAKRGETLHKKRERASRLSQNSIAASSHRSQ